MSDESPRMTQTNFAFHSKAIFLHVCLLGNDQQQNVVAGKNVRGTHDP